MASCYICKSEVSILQDDAPTHFANVEMGGTILQVGRQDTMVRILQEGWESNQGAKYIARQCTDTFCKCRDGRHRIASGRTDRKSVV